jgi:DNA (cytosine-5)-methyltransferase 1
VRPRLLDTFCKAGGGAAGYDRAGFEVTGVDIEPQPHFPFAFIQADALEVLADRSFLAQFDAIHASPPCQAYVVAATTRKRKDHPDLLGPVRALLRRSGLPWVIENVPTAPMPDAIILCGATFGLPIVRHRKFELSWQPGLVPSACPQRSWNRAVDHGPGFYPYAGGSWEPAWREHVLPVLWPWMDLAEAGQAIPPAYTEYLGAGLLGRLEGAAA